MPPVTKSMMFTHMDDIDDSSFTLDDAKEKSETGCRGFRVKLRAHLQGWEGDMCLLAKLEVAKCFLWGRHSTTQKNKPGERMVLTGVCIVVFCGLCVHFLNDQ